MTKEEVRCLESDPAGFAKALTLELREKFTEWDQLRDTEWTKELKAYLRGQAELACSDLKLIGGKKDFEQISTSREEKVSEFLLDVIWWRRDKVLGERIALALESEWVYVSPRTGERRDKYLVAEKVEEDFWKLTVIKAPLKVMLFTSSTEGTESLEEMREYVHSRIETILRSVGSRVSETYLVIDTGIAGDRAAWLCLPSGDGSEAKLERQTGWI